MQWTGKDFQKLYISSMTELSYQFSNILKEVGPQWLQNFLVRSSIFWCDPFWIAVRLFSCKANINFGFLFWMEKLLLQELEKLASRVDFNFFLTSTNFLEGTFLLLIILLHKKLNTVTLKIVTLLFCSTQNLFLFVNFESSFYFCKDMYKYLDSFSFYRIFSLRKVIWKV